MKRNQKEISSYVSLYFIKGNAGLMSVIWGPTFLCAKVGENKSCHVSCVEAQTSLKYRMLYV